MDDPIIRMPDIYSKSLRELVMEYMMREPLLRPSPLELQRRTARGLEMALAAAMLAAGDEGLTDIPLVGYK
jgi:hypothetical protein